MPDTTPERPSAQLTPEVVARDIIVQYLGSVPLVRMQAQHNASAFGDKVDSAYLVGAALQLGSLSFDSILTLMTRSIDAARAPFDAEAAWAEHSTGFVWESEEQRYAEYRAFLAGAAAARHA